MGQVMPGQEGEGTGLVLWASGQEKRNGLVGEKDEEGIRRWVEERDVWVEGEW